MRARGTVGNRTAGRRYYPGWFGHPPQTRPGKRAPRRDTIRTVASFIITKAGRPFVVIGTRTGGGRVSKQCAQWGEMVSPSSGWCLPRSSDGRMSSGV